MCVCMCAYVCAPVCVCVCARVCVGKEKKRAGRGNPIALPQLSPHLALHHTEER